MESAAGRVDDLAEPSLFARKATGLVKGWAVRDAFIYAFFSINLVTLGFFIFTYAVFIPDGSLFWAVVLSGGYLLLQAVTYASLVAAMPRAGGDYIWISRTLGGGIGFVLAACGWWFILWHWVPIYANILNVEVIVPLSSIIGWDGGVTFFSEDKGLFWASVITAVLASFLIALGIRTYARIQNFCFYGGLIGLAFMLVLLLINSKADFISALNTEGADVLGAKGRPLRRNPEGGLGHVHGRQRRHLRPAQRDLPVDPLHPLLQPVVELGGDPLRRGARRLGLPQEHRRDGRGAGRDDRSRGDLVPAVLEDVRLGLLQRRQQRVLGRHGRRLAFFPYPAQLASFLMGGAVWQFILIGLMSLWFFGWVGTVFLSSTRVVFATAFDRVLPEGAAKVSKSGVPYVALALMLIPSIPIAWLYAFNEDFFNWTLAATMVIAITFAGSAIGAAILPWRKPEIYNSSPIAKYRIAGVPLITVTAVGFLALLAFCLYKWLFDDVYALNDSGSLIYMGSLYVVAFLIYAVSRLWRRRQGIDMTMVHKEIPVE